MKSITVNCTSQLKQILETKSDEALEISLENKVYELHETIDIKRSNFTVKGNGATIKGSKKIDLCSLEAKDGIIKIDLTVHGAKLKDYHKARFPWCGPNPFDEVDSNWPRDPFGKTITDGPYCGSVYTIGQVGPDIDVFCDDKAMNLTRYPKSGFIDIKETLSDYDKDGIKPRIVEGGPKGIFVPDDEVFTKMPKSEEAILFGYWAYDWAPNHHAIKSVDSTNNVIEVDAPYTKYGYWDARGASKQRAKFYATNVFDALDEPGTWFVDRKSNEIYIHPFPNQKEVEFSVCDNIFTGKEIRNVTFENLKICQCTSCGFMFEETSDVTISNTLVKNVGEWGIVAKRSSGVKVSNCTVAETGGGGIFLDGGDRLTLKSSGNIVNNSEIYNIGKYYQVYVSGVELRGVNAIVSNCKIHDLPHFAIYYHGNNHIIENNEIFKVCNNSNDAGAIYTGKDYTFYGNIIRYNYFHDLYGMDNKGCSCLYFDDFCSSAEVFGNILANTFYAIQLGGGHDFEIHHNIFYNCEYLLIDNRARTGFWMHDQAKVMRERLKVSPYKNDVWKNAFPKLYNANLESDDFFMAYGNSLTDNRFINCGDIMLESPDIKDWLKMENNTFITQREPKAIDKDNISPNQQYILEVYSPLKVE